MTRSSQKLRKYEQLFIFDLLYLLLKSAIEWDDEKQSTLKKESIDVVSNTI